LKILNSNVTVNVINLETSIAFYESIGFTLKNRWGNYYAQLSVAGLTIGLHPTNESANTFGSGNVSIGFTSDNFEETKSLLQKLSIASTERNEEGGQFLHFNDPDGTSLYFMKPKW
jgi:catechol 2,3-dioxygenase-like lactoylglutathione lyase family enzyme